MALADSTAAAPALNALVATGAAAFCAATRYSFVVDAAAPAVLAMLFRIPPDPLVVPLVDGNWDYNPVSTPGQRKKK